MAKAKAPCRRGKTRFTACTFIGCDLSMMKLTGSSLQQVAFQECKLLGVDFSVSSAMLFSITCTDCPMDHAVFEARVMPEVTFKRCSLRGAVFERGDLQGAVLDDCDLSDAAFDGADLRKADLTTAYHLRIDPRATNMRGARVSTDGALDLLSVFGVVVE
jgi:uncharacterized protein YjbI with pentapeptide repeats